MKTYQNNEMVQRLREMASQILSPGSEGQKFFDAVASELEELQRGLDESVKLQSHYAGLLNIWDGGKRTVFPDSEDWLKRLRKTRKP
jgi:hypothetical protein